MSRHPDVQGIVSELAGTWSGTGDGLYPTIEAFRYREVTTFTERDDHPALLFEQRTWKGTPEGEVVSHWEVGLLRMSSDGTARLHTAQPGRAETMAGTWEKVDDGWVISLVADGFAGDDRVIGSTRTIRFGSNRLTYQMHMETISTHQMSLHLQATLARGSAARPRSVSQHRMGR